MADRGPRRIVSLLPAATELVYALGAAERLVGVSHECDHPPAATELPRVSRARVDAHAPSRALDTQVKQIKSKGESLYEIDDRLMMRLKPDLILTQVQCDVCAITPQDLAKSVERLDRRPTIVALDAQSLEGTLNDVRVVGDALGLHEEAKQLLLRQWRLIKEVRARVAGLERPRVAVLDWLDPLMFAGNWIPALANIAGGEAALVAEGKPSRWGSVEELVDYAPEVVIAAACGRDVATSRGEISTLVRTIGKDDVPAIEDGRVFIADGHQFFNRPGPRLVYSAALMARAFHPSLPPLPPALERYIVPWTAG